MAPAVLIVNEWWGQAIHGGSSAAARQIIRLVHAMGLKVYCTVLQSNTQAEAEAHELGADVLILPDPQGRLRLRKPHPDWLLAHEVYFPEFKVLHEIRIVFGFGLVTSDAALRIRNTMCSNAKFFLINVWSLQDATPRTLGYDLDEFMVRCELLVEESTVADAIFSFGPKTYECYQSRFSGSFQAKHYRLVPSPEPMFFELTPTPKLQDDEEIVILTALQGDDMRELDCQFVLAQTINRIARTYCENHNRRLTWKILGVPAAKEEYVRSILRPHPMVNLYPLAANIYENLTQQLNKAHLVLIPPRSGLSLQFALTAMAAGVPTLVPKGWDCHALFKDQLQSFEADMVVSMRTSTNALKKKILAILQSYETTREKANQVKWALKNEIGRALARKNEEFVNLTYSAFGFETTTEERLTRVIAGLIHPAVTLSERWCMPKRRQRTFGEVGVRVRTKGGVPKKGKTMVEIDNELYGLVHDRGPLDNAEAEAIRETNKKPGCGGVTFILECKTLDALECLWNEYQGEKLLQMMEDTILSDKVRQEVGVNHMTLRCHIDYEEYNTCRIELKDKKEREERQARNDMERMEH